MSRYSDMDGNPMALMEWAAAFENSESRILGRTTVGDAEVSTVWIGLEDSVFETMVFGGDHDGDQWRYSTREQALEGHAAAVALLTGAA